MRYLGTRALQPRILFDNCFELFLIFSVRLDKQHVPALLKRFFKARKVNVGHLHTNEAGFPGGETKTNNGEK